MKCRYKNSRQEGSGRWRGGREQRSRQEDGVSRDRERSVWLEHLERQAEKEEMGTER